MTAALLLAIDVGLTNVKAVAFDAGGALVARSSIGYPTRRPTSDGAEQDPAEWWTAVVLAVQALPSEIRGRVAAMGVTGHMHALVALDAAGEPVAAAMILGDRRAAPDAAAITASVGGDVVYAITGAELDASMPAAKARFLARTDPDRWRRVAHLVGCKDYLLYRLTGALATEPVDACATSLFDIGRACWSHEMLEAAGVAPGLMPEVCAPWDRAGGLATEAARTLGLRGGIPVAVGAGDDVVVLGFGMVEPGVALEHIGTTGSVMAVAGRPTPDPDRRLELYPHVLPGRWVVGGSHTTAGAAIAWAADLLGYPSVEASLTALARPGLDGLAFLPTLAGERFPERIPAARGGWVGLSLDMSQDALMRAVFEGVATSLGAILARIDDVVGPQSAVNVSTADDERWLALRAATYARPLRVSRTTEPTALGLAALVAVAAGVHPDVRSAVAAMTGVARTVAVPPSARRATLDPEAVLRDAWAAADAARERASRPPRIDTTESTATLVDSGTRT